MKLLEANNRHAEALARVRHVRDELSDARTEHVEALKAVNAEHKKIHNRFNAMQYTKTNHYDDEWFDSYEEFHIMIDRGEGDEPAITMIGQKLYFEDICFNTVCMNDRSQPDYCWLGHP